MEEMTDQPKTEYVIISGWLCEDTKKCTCGSLGLFPHEQHCGIENIATVADLLREHDDYEGLKNEYKEAAAVATEWRTQISEVLGMTTMPEQGYTATLAEAVARIKEIIESRNMFRQTVQDRTQQNQAGWNKWDSGGAPW